LSARQRNPAVPGWVNNALNKAVEPNPAQRYAYISEFITDLKKPNASLAQQHGKPLIERHPLRFWQVLALLELLVIGYLVLQLVA